MLSRWLLILIAALGIAAPALAAAAPALAATDSVAAADATACEGLAGGQFAKIPGAPTWVITAKYTAASPGKRATCAVDGYVNPTINFGLIMPARNADGTPGWNGKYMVRGCGGSCGIQATAIICTGHVRDGYACLHTDMGHRSTMVDNNWVDNNLQGLVDFGYRATHVTTVAGKAIMAAFYARGPDKSYFFACSTGGRQGLIEAERFPQDFDGIVAIAPASLGPFGNNRAASVSDVDAFNLDAAGKPILPNRKALLVHLAVVRACDANDGVLDGVIGDPRMCKWEPEMIACKGAATGDCLTPAQVGVVHAMYTRRGAMKGSELNWIGNYLRNATLPGEESKPVFDLGVGRGDPTTVETMINPNNPDLRPFRDHGAKLILVQGWTDHSVMPPPTVDWFETMTRTMGGTADRARFAQFFAIPGMDHCAGGEGATAIDYSAAIDAWVTTGKAPDRLIGVHPKVGAPLDYFGVDLKLLDPKWVAFSRPHFAYPAVAVYAKGDPALASSFRPSLTPATRATAKLTVEAPPTGTLTEQLTATIATSEAASNAALFPRNSVLNAMQKAIWVTLGRSGGRQAAQTAALDAIDRTTLTSIGREAVARIAAELKLD